MGKVNYCLQSLIQKGAVKADNFRNSKDKSAYLYKLTPIGIEEKSRVTRRFLAHKLAEYEAIKKEIAELKADVKKLQVIKAQGRGRLRRQVPASILPTPP